MAMNKKQSNQLIKSISLSSSFKEIELEDKSFWISQSPNKRLEHIEELRKINYGKEATKRLQRVLQVTKRA